MSRSTSTEPVSDFDADEVDKLLDDLQDDDADDDGLLKHSHKSLKSSKNFPPVSGLAKSPAKSSIKSPKSPDLIKSPTSGRDTPKKVTFSGSEDTKPDDGEVQSSNQYSRIEPRSTSPSASVRESKETSPPGVHLSPSSSALKKANGDKQNLNAKNEALPGKNSPSSIMSARAKKSSDIFGGDDHGIFGDLDKKLQPPKSSSVFDAYLSGNKESHASSSAKKSQDLLFDSKFNKNLPNKTDSAYNPSKSPPSVQPRGKIAGLLVDDDDDFFGTGGFLGGGYGVGNSASGKDKSSAQGGTNGGPVSRSGRRGKPETAKNARKSFEIDDSDIVGTSRNRRAQSADNKSDSPKESAASTAVTSGAMGAMAASAGKDVHGEPSETAGGGWLNSLLKKSSSPKKSTPPSLEGSPSQAAAAGKATSFLLSYPDTGSLALAGLTASGEIQAQLQEQLLLQQQQAAQQLQEQQKHIQEQFAKQTVQQISQQRAMMDLLAKQQEVAVRRCQNALLGISNFGLLGLPVEVSGAAAPAIADNINVNNNSKNNSNDDSSTNKKLNINDTEARAKQEAQEVLRKAQVEVEKLSAELEVLRAHHEQELELLTKSYETKLKFSDELHVKKEELLHKQHDQLVQHHQCVLQLLQEQHELQLQEVQKMKDMEVAAVQRNAARCTEANVVSQQLSSNAALLTELSSNVQQQSDAAQQVLQQALQAQQQQVASLEAQLTAGARAAEAEQERLRALVTRLEQRVAAQQAELQENTWRLGREQRQLAQDIANWQKKKLSEEQRLAAAAAGEQQKLDEAAARLRQQQELLQQKATRLKVEESLLASKRRQDAAVPGLDPRPGPLGDRLLGPVGDRLLGGDESRKLAQRREELAAERADVLELKAKLERERMDMILATARLQSEQKALQQEQESLTLQRQQLQSKAAALQQRLHHLQAETEAAHLIKLQAAKERDRTAAAIQRLQELATRGLCSRCGRPLWSFGASASSDIYKVPSIGPPIPSTSLPVTIGPPVSSIDIATSLGGEAASSGVTVFDAASDGFKIKSVDYRPEAVMARLEAARAEDALTLKLNIDPLVQ
ncbi:adventurous-gliding motility protein Z [Hyalella azteca]|uniref:Adventurous-gliding motility protein Z n=1 Tax=Hyalella azteca TaxID=294128 RepID=A0A979FNH2_HYAAZ|nr:adventurous-gliding motility protein Z [Hyalella azteca]